MSNAENVPPGETGGAGSGAGTGAGSVAGRSLAREVHRVAASPPAGVRVHLNESDLTDLLAVIDGPAGTPYAGGVFRVRVSLAAWPGPPRAVFLTRVFHPNVAPRSGEVCVSTLSRDWRPELGLRHALLALVSLLIAPNPDSALNAAAAELLATDYRDYARRAAMLTEIHARPTACAASTAATAAPAHAPAAPAAAATAAAAKRPAGATVKRDSDKRRILKRL